MAPPPPGGCCVRGKRIFRADPVARFGDIRALVADPADNFEVVDAGNDAVRKMTPAGVVSSVAQRFTKMGEYDQSLCTP